MRGVNIVFFLLSILIIFTMSPTSVTGDWTEDFSVSKKQKIEPEFLETLNSGYENIFADWKKSPVIHIDVAEFNCLSQLDVENLANEVKNYIAV